MENDALAISMLFKKQSNGQSLLNRIDPAWTGGILPVDQYYWKQLQEKETLCFKHTCQRDKFPGYKLASLPTVTYGYNVNQYET